MIQEPYILPPTMRRGMKVLLHVCCAPCSCAILDTMVASGLRPTVFFYNPNIHPREEYEKRKAEIIAFAAKRLLPFIDADYDTEAWFSRVKGLEQEPERGKRCSACFGLRLERTALFAHENGFPFIATSLSISRHKNQEQVHEAGLAATFRYQDVTFWPYNWRQKGGVERGNALSKNEGFYRQDYCGCVFSLRKKADETRQ